MKPNFRFRDRRASIRLKMTLPAIYTRFDNKGKAYGQKVCRSMNVSLGGVKLQSSSPVSSGELIDITMTLDENVLTFKGKVIYVKSSEDQGFELGVSIEDIKNEDRIALNRFIYYYKGLRT